MNAHLYNALSLPASFRQVAGNQFSRDRLTCCLLFAMHQVVFAVFTSHFTVSRCVAAVMFDIERGTADVYTQRPLPGARPAYTFSMSHLN